MPVEQARPNMDGGPVSVLVEIVAASASAHAFAMVPAASTLPGFNLDV